MRSRASIIVGIAALALILDGLDQQMLPMAAPLILKEWGISRTVMGQALVGAMVGVALGGLIGGYLGDRFGKLRVMTGSIIVFGLATAALGYASAVWQMTALRFIGGLAFGAVMPNAIALASLAVAPSIQSTVVGLLVLAAPVGMALAAGLSSLLLPELGWRLLFIVAGIAPLVLAGITMLVHRAAPIDIEPARAAPERADDGRVIGILAPEVRLATLGLWTLFFANGCVAASMNWLPVIVSDAGFSVEQAGRVAMLFTLSVLGGTGIASILYRVTAVWKVALLSVLGVLGGGTVLMVLLGQAPLPVAAVLGLMMVFALSSGGIQTSCYVLASMFYPARNRAFGIGAAMGFNRAGGFVSVLSGGAALEATRGDPRVFLGGLLLIMLVGLIGAAMIGVGVRRDRLGAGRFGDARLERAAA